MAIISVSLPDESVTAMDAAIDDGDYKGRSQYVRASLHHYLAERPTLTGHVHGSVTLTYAHGEEARISDLRHAFHDVVLSLMHTHCEPEVCMDVLIVGGPGPRIQELGEAVERHRAVRSSRLVVV